MDSLKTLLLSGIISIAVSFITVRITHKYDVRKHILEERTAFYLNYFLIIDQLVNHPEKVFDHSYMKELIDYKGSMKLLASKKVFAVYDELLSVLLPPYNLYDIYYGYQEDPQSSNYDPEDWARMDKKDLELDESAFQAKHLPERKKIDSCIERLYAAMRKDLGSNLK